MLTKKRVLITGGPTRAYLDRVRFISNYSSGRLAYLLAEQLVGQGADVVAVCGLNSQPFDSLGLVRYHSVETIDEMLSAVLNEGASFEPTVAVFAAAVLDFVPQSIEVGKVTSKKSWTVNLQPAPKIIDEFHKKFPRVSRIGFKLEWERSTEQTPKQFALSLIKRKGLSALCLNYLSEMTENQHPAFIVNEQGQSWKETSKQDIACRLCDLIGTQG